MAEQNLLRDQQLDQKRRELVKVARQIDRIIDAIADGSSTAGLKERLFALEDRKGELDTELRTTPPPAPRLHPSLAEVYRQKVADLEQALHELDSREEALGILRGLIDQVVIRPAEPGFTIKLVGEIANMLRISAGTGTFTIGPYARSLKVVAGARCHRESLVLHAEI